MKSLVILFVTLSAIIVMAAGQLVRAQETNAPKPDNFPAVIRQEFGAEITDLQPGDTLEITDTVGKKVGTVLKDESGKISIAISITNSNIQTQKQKTEARADQPKPKLKAIHHRARHHKAPATKPAAKPQPKPAPTPAPTGDEKSSKESAMLFGIPAWAWAIIALVLIALIWRWLNPAPTAPTPAPAPRGPGAGTAAYRGSGTSTPLGLDLNNAEAPPLDMDDVLNKDYEVTEYTTPTSRYRKIRRNRVVEKMPDPRPGHAYAEVRIPAIELGVVCREPHSGTGPARLTVDDVERLMKAKTSAADRTEKVKEETSSSKDEAAKKKEADEAARKKREEAAAAKKVK